MLKVPQIYNLDILKLTAPFHPLPSLVQGGGWCVRAAGSADAVRIPETSTLPAQLSRMSSHAKGKALQQHRWKTLHAGMEGDTPLLLNMTAAKVRCSQPAHPSLSLTDPNTALKARGMSWFPTAC